MTLGEERIRTSFNPSDDSIVQNIKERMAETLNYINDNVSDNVSEDAEKWPSEVLRLKALAFTKLEEASLFAVKAATYKK